MFNVWSCVRRCFANLCVFTSMVGSHRDLEQNTWSIQNAIISFLLPLNFRLSYLSTRVFWIKVWTPVRKNPGSDPEFAGTRKNGLCYSQRLEIHSERFNKKLKCSTETRNWETYYAHCCSYENYVSIRLSLVWCVFGTRASHREQNMTKFSNGWYERNLNVFIYFELRL